VFSNDVDNNEHKHQTSAIHKVAVNRNAISFALMCDALHCIINFNETASCSDNKQDKRNETQQQSNKQS